MIKINATTANFPGKCYSQATYLASTMKSNWATIVNEHMQLCPQQCDFINESFAEKIRDKYKSIKFRCHANVRLFDFLHIFDASSAQEDILHKEYIEKLKLINDKLNADKYSVHAGSAIISLDKMKDNVLRLQDKLNIDVAVEGLYPHKKINWLISSWSEYNWLLESELNMAIDLSHLQIVAKHEGYWNADLVQALLQSEKCLEIHVSSNDGINDSHTDVVGEEDWLKLLNVANKTSVIFTEENQIKRRNK
jgi:hypothetical protein